MKIKKTISDKVIAANRQNAQKSTGPKNMDAVKRNACTHGLLSKNLYFQNEEERSEFEEILKQLQADQNTTGLLEKILVEEAASSIWKLRITNGWDLKELLNRRGTAKAVLQGVAEMNDDEEMLINSYGGEAVQRGWDCQELVIRTDSRKAKEEEEFIEGMQKKSRQVHVEAKLTTSLDTVMRYRSAIKRDLYRAISALRESRRVRHQGGQEL